MMVATNLFLCCLFAVTFSATIPRDIPVEIRYEGTDSVRNLDAKVQLSQEELGQSLKHLPPQEPAELPLAATVAENAVRIAQIAAEPSPIQSSQPPVESSQPPVESSQPPVADPQPPVAEPLPPVADPQPPVESSQPAVADPQSPVESSQPAVADPQPPVESSQPAVADPQPPVESAQPALRSPQVPAEPSEAVTLESRLQQLRQTVVGELNRLRSSFRPTKGESQPDQEQWASLEKAVDELFDQQRSTIYNKQATEGGSGSPAPGQNNNIFQNIINGVTQLTSGWVANIQNNGPPGTQGDAGAEGTNNQGSGPGGFQGFVQYFTNGVSSIMNQITNNNGPTTSNTLLGDSGVTSSPSNNPLAAVGGFFSSVANNVQQVFNGPNNSPPGTQGDTGSNPASGPPSPIQAIQNFGNTVSSAFNNIFQGQAPASTSGDEGVPTNGGPNIIQSIGNAIQNSPLNPFRPQNNNNAQKPAEPAQQPSGTQAPSVAPSADNQKKPAEEAAVAPVVPVETIIPDKPEETQGENEIDAKKETLVTSQ